MINIRLRFILYLATLSCFLIFSAAPSDCAEITGPETKISNDEIFVTTGLLLDEAQIQELKNGISKEITFYIDLFRVWSMWPDEFVLGKTIVKTLKSDPIKKEYVASSFDGTTITEKRFNEPESMLKWTLDITDLKLTNIKELEPDEYFIRVTVESRLRRLPPVINYFLFFVKETEYRILKDSQKFSVGRK